MEKIHSIYWHWPMARKWLGWLGWCQYMMGIPAEECSVTGSLVFSIIIISRPQYGGYTQLCTKSDHWTGSASNNSGDVNTWWEHLPKNSWSNVPWCFH
jgi:hypothetical protein